MARIPIIFQKVQSKHSGGPFSQYHLPAQSQAHRQQIGGGGQTQDNIRQKKPISDIL
jgi:hypothetical protein